MCGIACVFDLKGDKGNLRNNILSMSKKLRHRGPDWSGIFADDFAILGHERLAIVDPISGRQPLFNKEGTHALAVNGEIYNHRELRAELEDKKFKKIMESVVLVYGV